MPDTNPDSNRVVFTPSGQVGSIDDGATVLDAARQLGVDLDSVCGGRGLCGRCQIVPSFGSFAKWAIDSEAENLSEWSATEDGYRGKRPLVDGQRLGCAVHISGDVVIDVPAESQIHRQVIRKDLNLGAVSIDPIYSAHYVELSDGASPEQLVSALTEQWGLAFDGTVPELPELGSSATVVLRQTEKDGLPVMAAVFDGFVDALHGVAVDIGSTTIAAHLIDLATGAVLASSGRMNPQIRFGEDLMSRVSYVMMNPGGDKELTDAVRNALAELVTELVAEAESDPAHILDMVLVGNPVMHHLVLGFDPTPLGQSPFPLAIDGAFHTTASELDLGLENASVYVAPCIAGHVGADTAAAILAEGPHRSEQIQLLVDVGTNAEIVLGNSKQLLAASSPTGPAFEGAQISAGQRATAGAIERVAIDRETLEPRFRVIGCEAWSDDPNFDELNPAGVTGICGSGIIEVLSEMVSAGIIDAKGVIRGELSGTTPRVVADERTFSYVLHEGIQINQADVRAIQLAKAALKAGIDLLLEHAELETVDEIRLAGAFGAHIDPAHAINLGLIPPCDTVGAVGNSAGVGAVRALLSAEQRREMEATVSAVTKIETAIEPRFQELFVTALGFANAPHQGNDDNESAGGVNTRGGRRRRRRPAS